MIKYIVRMGFLFMVIMIGNNNLQGALLKPQEYFSCFQDALQWETSELTDCVGKVEVSKQLLQHEVSAPCLKETPTASPLATEKIEQVRVSQKILTPSEIQKKGDALILNKSLALGKSFVEEMQRLIGMGYSQCGRLKDLDACKEFSLTTGFPRNYLPGIKQYVALYLELTKNKDKVDLLLKTGSEHYSKKSVKLSGTLFASADMLSILKWKEDTKEFESIGGLDTEKVVHYFSLGEGLSKSLAQYSLNKIAEYKEDYAATILDAKKDNSAPTTSARPKKKK